MWTWFKLLVGLTHRPAPIPDVPDYDPLSSIKFNRYTRRDKAGDVVSSSLTPVPTTSRLPEEARALISVVPEPKPVQSELRTSDKGLAIIQEFEGFRSKAYRCPAGIWTIGYGHTSAAGMPHVYKGMTVTKEEAKALLKRDVVQYERAVLNYVRVSMTQNEFDALVSFCYNIGVTAFSKSSVVRFLNSGKKGLVGSGLALWTKGGGKVLPGLVKRRAMECDLFYGKK